MARLHSSSVIRLSFRVTEWTALQPRLTKSAVHSPWEDCVWRGWSLSTKDRWPRTLELQEHTDYEKGGWTLIEHHDLRSLIRFTGNGDNFRHIGSVLLESTYLTGRSSSYSQPVIQRSGYGKGVWERLLHVRAFPHVPILSFHHSMRLVSNLSYKAKVICMNSGLCCIVTIAIQSSLQWYHMGFQTSSIWMKTCHFVLVAW